MLVVSDIQIGKLTLAGASRVPDESPTHALNRVLPFVHSTIVLGGRPRKGAFKTWLDSHTQAGEPSGDAQDRSSVTDVVEARPEGVYAARRGRDVATVPSNSAWRQGQSYLGKPGDDCRLDVHRAVQSVFSTPGRTTFSGFS